jgi:small subunit ribosomal protein S17
LTNNRLNYKMEKTKEKKMKEKGLKKSVSPRGRSFKGAVIKVFSDRLMIQFERLLYLRKYERYEKRKTKIQAKIPIDLRGQIEVGDYIEIKECRPLSKSIHFIVTKKIRSIKNEINNS